MILRIFATFVHLYVPWELCPPMVHEVGDSCGERRRLGPLVGRTQVFAGVLRTFFKVGVRTGLFVPKPYPLDLALPYLVFALDLLLFPNLSDLLKWDDVLLQDKLLWLFQGERALLRVLAVLEDPLEDRSNKPLIFELSEPSSSESSLKKELHGPTGLVRRVLPVNLFLYLLLQPPRLLPFLVASQPLFHLLLVQADCDAESHG
ncbi:hypothetical protein Tco_1451017 [Tanacetum coccineum]